MATQRWTSHQGKFLFSPVVEDIYVHTIIPSILQECFNSGRETALNFHAEQYLDRENLNSPELHRHTELRPTFVIYTILHVPKYFLVMPEALLRIDVRLLSGSSVLPSTSLSTCLQIQLCSWFTKWIFGYCWASSENSRQKGHGTDHSQGQCGVTLSNARDTVPLFPETVNT